MEKKKEVEQVSGRVKKKASKPMRIRKGVRVKVRMSMCNFGGRQAGATVWEGTSCCGVEGAGSWPGTL